MVLPKILVLTTTYLVSPKALHAEHVAAWAALWRSGVEIGGRKEAAIAFNTSLYTVLSSLRADWPYSCCGSGLYSNGPSTLLLSSDSSQFPSTCSSLPLVFGCLNTAC